MHYFDTRSSKLWGIIGLMLSLVMVIITALFMGPSRMSAVTIYDALLGQGTETASHILWHIRIPRILLGIAVGGGLSLCGLLLQTVFRNPLVEPYTLGISGGAALGAGVLFLFPVSMLGIWSLPVFGFLGALAMMGLIYCMTPKQMDIHRLLLTGIMMSVMSGAILVCLMAMASPQEMSRLIFWLMGHLDESHIPTILVVLSLSVLGLIYAYSMAMPLNALLLGRQEADYLGLSTQRLYLSIFIVASFVTGACVSVAGIIGFVGLLVPHVIRLLFGYDHRFLLIATFVMGAVFLVSSDILARIIVPSMPLPVGVITGIVGGLGFIFLLYKQKR